MNILVNMDYISRSLYRNTLVNRWLIQIIRNIHGLLSRFKMYVIYLILKFQTLLQ
nr:MAG TPA: hypothetical protein [Bacteriophage sp.]